MRSIIIALALCAGLSSCATVSKYTIENRLQDLGLSSSRANCMAEELEQQLNADELSEFARFTVTISSRRTAIGVLDQLSTISNPRISRAVGTAGLICIIRS